MTSFGFDILISMLLPGSVMMASAGLVLWKYGIDSIAGRWLVWASEKDLLISIVLVILSALFGGMLASILEKFEWICLDPREAKKLEISKNQYDEEWYLYVESLTDSGNRYLSGKARLFFFQYRTGAALLFLAPCWFLAASTCVEKWLGASLAVLAGTMLLCLAKDNHYLLADWRHRLFGDLAKSRLQEEQE